MRQKHRAGKKGRFRAPGGPEACRRPHARQSPHKVRTCVLLLSWLVLVISCCCGAGGPAVDLAEAAWPPPRPTSRIMCRRVRPLQPGWPLLG